MPEIKVKAPTYYITRGIKEKPHGLHNWQGVLLANLSISLTGCWHCFRVSAYMCSFNLIIQVNYQQHHCTDEETEAQRGYITCPRSPS